MADNSLLCLFTGTVREDGGRYLVEIPDTEIDAGTLDPDTAYRVAMLRDGAATAGDAAEGTESRGAPTEPQPPVTVGEMRYVEIEDIGKQGDGIARVERGYVIIVPDSEEGQRVKVEVTEVKQNFAVGRIVEAETDRKA
jgi:predicted RNA-binding protein with TRAM domain